MYWEEEREKSRHSSTGHLWGWSVAAMSQRSCPASQEKSAAVLGPTLNQWHFLHILQFPTKAELVLSKWQISSTKARLLQITGTAQKSSVPSTYRQQGSGTEHLDGVMSTPATSIWALSSQTSPAYSSFHHILMPTVFCCAFPEEKKYIFTIYWPQCLGEYRACLLWSPWMAFFILSSGLVSTQIEN